MYKRLKARQQRGLERYEQFWGKIFEDSRKIEQEEDNKLQKKSKLISELRNVLLELLKKHDDIQLCIESKKNEQIEEFNKRMSSFAIEFLSNPSIKPPRFEIYESFIELLSTSKPRLEEISKQMKFINELIEKISSNSSDIEISEHEQRIIEILSAKSFLGSQVVESVQRMIDFSSNMKDCFELLKTYSKKFIPSMVHYMDKYERNPNDFKLNSKNLELQHNNLDKLLKGLSEIKEKIEMMKSFFSEEFLFKLLFTQQSDDFLFVFEYTKLEFQIKQMNQIFKTVMEYIVKIGQAKFDNCKNFVDEVNRDERDRCRRLFVSLSTFVEPVEELLRKKLEASLSEIARIRV